MLSIQRPIHSLILSLLTAECLVISSPWAQSYGVHTPHLEYSYPSSECPTNASSSHTPLVFYTARSLYSVSSAVQTLQYNVNDSIQGRTLRSYIKHLSYGTDDFGQMQIHKIQYHAFRADPYLVHNHSVSSNYALQIKGKVCTINTWTRVEITCFQPTTAYCTALKACP